MHIIDRGIVCQSLIRLCALSVAIAGRTPLCADVTIQDVTENVRRNEMLYENLDVASRYTYNVVDRAPFHSEEGFKEITSIDAQDHYVTQRGMFRLDRVATATMDAAPHSFDRVRAFDGTTTRLYDQQQVGNIIPGRVEDDSAFRPHILFICNVIHAPLSTYLAGHEAMAAHPMGGKKWRDRLTVNATYEGAEDRSGMRCHRVWITTSLRGGPQYDRWELWLAEERNYLPIEMKSWTFSYSEQLPFSAGEAKEFREIAPGVWLPFDVNVVAYDPIILQSEGRQMPNWRRRFVVEEASLDPNYPFSYFHDVVMPEGTVVYEVENRTVKRSHRIGAPEVSSDSSTNRGAPWLLLANAAIVMMAGGAIAWGRRRRRAAAM